MFWSRPSFRLAAIILAICLAGLQFPRAEAITFAYNSYAAANFNDQTLDGFSFQGTYGFTLRTGTNYALNASGRSAEAKASSAFSQIVPPFKITFEVNITYHINTSRALEFAYVRFGSSPIIEVRLYRSASGKLAVQLNSSSTSETNKNIRIKGWQSIVVIYDPSVPKVEVDVNGSQAYSSSGPSSYLNGSVSVSLGVLEVSSKSPGEVLLDNFALSISPLAESERSMYSPGDTVYIVGRQFSSSADIDITVKDPGGRTIRSSTVLSDGNGLFRTNLNLSTTASSGRYEISAADSSRGHQEVKSSFGVWKPSKSTVQRAERFTFSGGGARGSAALTIEIFKGMNRIQLLSISASGDGSFTVETELGPNVDIGSYSARISGPSTADYPYRSFSDSLSLDVTSAVLDVRISTDKSVYNRTQIMSVAAQALYPDGTSVPSSSSLRLNLYYGRVLIKDAQMAYSSSGNKWTFSHVFGSSAFLGNYTINVKAIDTYGNAGSSNLTVKVEPAALSIIISGIKGTYQRTEVINLSASILYPDSSLVTSGNFKMQLKLPGVPIREVTMQYDANRGLWAIPRDNPYVISADEAVGHWTLTVVGSDDSGNPGDESLAITIVQAKISILDATINASYPRTSRIAYRIRALYPSGSALSLGRVTIVLSVSSGQKYEFALYRQTGESVWTGEVVLGKDFAIGLAHINLTASDPYANSGSWTGSFNITLAVLRIAIEAEKPDIQIGFDSVTLVGNITYPDGSQLTAGTVIASISTGNTQLKVLNMTYSQGVGWRGVYTPGIFDPSGAYSIDITAHDAYGNGGQVSLSVNASQTLLIVTIGLVILAVTIGIVLWIRSRRSSLPHSSSMGPELGL